MTGLILFCIEKQYIVVYSEKRKTQSAKCKTIIQNLKLFS